jgi:acyl-CoA thioesterase FadM
MAFFTQDGLPLAELMRLRVSWVMMKNEVRYHREIEWMEEIYVTGAARRCGPRKRGHGQPIAASDA